LNWTVANGTPQSATIVLILYREAPAINSVAFYADKASDQAAYSLNILMAASVSKPINEARAIMRQSVVARLYCACG